MNCSLPPIFKLIVDGVTAMADKVLVEVVVVVDDPGIPWHPKPAITNEVVIEIKSQRRRVALIDPP
jgi:hypothetical protein